MINNAELSHEFAQLHRSYSLFHFLKREKIFQEYSMIVSLTKKTQFILFIYIERHKAYNELKNDLLDKEIYGSFL